MIQVEIDVGDTIEYDVKSYQVIKTIIKFTNLIINALKF